MDKIKVYQKIYQLPEFIRNFMNVFDRTCAAFRFQHFPCLYVALNLGEINLVGQDPIPQIPQIIPPPQIYSRYSNFESEQFLWISYNNLKNDYYLDRVHLLSKIKNNCFLIIILHRNIQRSDSPLNFPTISEM